MSNSPGDEASTVVLLSSHPETKCSPTNINIKHHTVSTWYNLGRHSCVTWRSPVSGYAGRSPSLLSGDVHFCSPLVCISVICSSGLDIALTLLARALCLYIRNIVCIRSFYSNFCSIISNLSDLEFCHKTQTRSFFFTSHRSSLHAQSRDRWSSSSVSAALPASAAGSFGEI